MAKAQIDLNILNHISKKIYKRRKIYFREKQRFPTEHKIYKIIKIFEEGAKIVSFLKQKHFNLK